MRRAALVRLDLRVDAQGLVMLLLVEGEAVDAHDRAVAPVDLELDAIGRPLDLRLLEALLDRGDGAALVLDSLDEGQGS